MKRTLLIATLTLGMAAFQSIGQEDPAPPRAKERERIRQENREKRDRDLEQARSERNQKPNRDQRIERRNRQMAPDLGPGQPPQARRDFRGPRLGGQGPGPGPNARVCPHCQRPLPPLGQPGRGIGPRGFQGGPRGPLAPPAWQGRQGFQRGPAWQGRQDFGGGPAWQAPGFRRWQGPPAQGDEFPPRPPAGERFGQGRRGPGFAPPGPPTDRDERPAPRRERELDR